MNWKQHVDSVRKNTKDYPQPNREAAKKFATMLTNDIDGELKGYTQFLTTVSREKAKHCNHCCKYLVKLKPGDHGPDKCGKFGGQTYFYPSINDHVYCMHCFEYFGNRGTKKVIPHMMAFHDPGQAQAWGYNPDKILNSP